MPALIRDGMVTNSVFHQQNLTQNYNATHAMEGLNRHVAPGASYKSDEQYNEPKLPDEAQALILDYIEALISSPPSPQSSIEFVFGSERSGNSTMARALCERLAKKDLLAANFFFKHQHSDLGRRGLLIPTITYQLCRALPAMRRHVELVIQDDPLFIHANLETQLNQLIVQPLLRLKLDNDLPDRVLVVVFDGLDECDDEAAQTYILRIFWGALSTAELPVRLLVFSRPIPHLVDAISGMDIVGVNVIGDGIKHDMSIWHRTATIVASDRVTMVTLFFFFPLG
ncbi:hypothetical protein BJ165DRAFT_1011459 [Panaeolus papilionaceus]|nr:hypothetical protein BJ165DRAFT_1011459 [Panaeolus papilionaceus]